MADDQQYVSTDPSAAKVTYLSTDPSAAKVGAPPNLNDPNGPLAVGAQQFISDLNPAPAIKTAWDAAIHGQDPVAAAIINPIIAQSAQRLAAARTALAQGDHSTAALHFLGTVPVVGPIADDLLSAVRSGDHTKAAKALGDAAALAGPTLMSGGADIAAEAAAPTVADAAQAGAESRIASAMGPQNGWGRSKAGKKLSATAADVAPDVLAAGPNAVRTSGLASFVDTNLQAASDAWKAAEADRRPGRAIDTGPIIAQLQSKIDALTAQPIDANRLVPSLEGPGGRPLLPSRQTRDPMTGQVQAAPNVVGRPIGAPVQGPNRAPQIAVIQGAINRLKQLGPMATYEDLRKIRQDYDAGSDYSPSIASTSEQNTASKQNSVGNKAAAGAIRDALAQSDPKLAAANANLNIWQKASDVMDAADEINRTATKGGNFAAVAKIMPAMLGASGGAALGGIEGAQIGGFLGAALKVASDSGYTTKIATARALGTLSSAIRAGDAATVARTLASIASITGTVVPVVNQSLSGAGASVPVNIPQDPINVPLAAANRGGGS